MSMEHRPCRCFRHFGPRWAVKIAVKIETNGIAQDVLQKLVQYYVGRRYYLLYVLQKLVQTVRRSS